MGGWARFVCLTAVLLHICASVAAAANNAPPASDTVKALQAKALSMQLHESRMWQVLLHYRKSWTGSWRSEADGSAFFLSGAAGKTNPKAELLATIAALFQGPVATRPGQSIEEAQHPQCRFPARWQWLKTTLAITEVPDQPCPIYEQWRQGISAQKVTLVYAAAYVNSPASMYGHTFLRLTRSTGEGNPLLDYIINYAADVDTKNGLVYAFKGVFGGFRGLFYAMPYYMKIQEYSNIESRDLWEYELSLSPQQSERLVQHTWETRTTHFDYFFFGENCSYFLLGLLEAADPSLHLSEQFGGVTIPANTVRAVLNVPGLVTSSMARPSLRATMFAQKRALSGKQMETAEALARDGKRAAGQIAGEAPAKQAQIIDAGYARLRYKEGLTWPPSESFERKERELLVMRGRTRAPPQSVQNVAFVGAPETGHRTLRLSLGAGTTGNGQSYERGQTFQDFSIRFAIHDFLDAHQGYPEDALLEMVNLRLRFVNQPNKLFVDRLNLLHIVSAAPINSWFIAPSWKVWAGGAQAYELGCLGWSCSYGGLNTGGGFAWRPFRPTLLWSMADLAAHAGPAFRGSYRVGLGGSAGAVISWGRLAQTELGGQYVRHLLGDTRSFPTFSMGHAFNLGRRVQLRFVAESFAWHVFARAELMAYF